MFLLQSSASECWTEVYESVNWKFVPPKLHCEVTCCFPHFCVIARYVVHGSPNKKRKLGAKYVLPPLWKGKLLHPTFQFSSTKIKTEEWLPFASHFWHELLMCLHQSLHGSVQDIVFLILRLNRVARFIYLFNDTVNPFFGANTGKCTMWQNNAVIFRQLWEKLFPKHRNWTQMQVSKKMLQENIHLHTHAHARTHLPTYLYRRMTSSKLDVYP